MLLYYVAGSYIISSVVLFLCPQLLHKPGRVTFPSRFQAHRGGGGEWTENTMSAFKQAELIDVELFELDVQVFTFCVSAAKLQLLKYFSSLNLDLHYTSMQYY